MATGSPSMSNGRKDDEGKAPLGRGLLAYFPEALWEVAHVSRYGTGKYETTYAERNWTKVEDGEQRYLDAALRHITAHLTGQTYDAESGQSHLAHAAWSILAARELGVANLRGQLLDPDFERDTGARMQEANDVWDEVQRGMVDAVLSSR